MYGATIGDYRTKKRKEDLASSELKVVQPLPIKVWIQTSKLNSNDLW
jgi:hypothetical protein